MFPIIDTSIVRVNTLSELTPSGFELKQFVLCSVQLIVFENEKCDIFRLCSGLWRFVIVVDKQSRSSSFFLLYTFAGNKFTFCFISFVDSKVPAFPVKTLRVSYS